MRPVLVGVAGPDGSGKTTLATAMAAGATPGSRPLYLYGCVICRRWPGRPLSAAREVGGRSRRRPLRLLHGVVDAGELSLRLGIALAAARLSRRPLVVTDRTPLDALAKLDPAAGSPIAAWYRRLASRYDRLLWLDAPATTLAARDREHSEAELEVARRWFATWAPALPNVERIDASASPSELRARAMAGLGASPGRSQPQPRRP